MTRDTTTLVLVMTCIANAAVHVVAEWRRWETIRPVTKIAASTAFVLLAFYNGAEGSAYGRAISIALLLSWLGDALLLSLRRRYLLAGIGAFLIAHLAFAVGFVTLDVNIVWLMVALIVTSGAAVWFLSGLWKYLGPLYKIAVPFYLAAIALMTSLAIAASAASLSPVLAIAAIMFAVSDVSVAFNRFIERKIINKIWGLPLYYAAQLLFAMSVLWHR